jgi:hypothetical protein
LSLFASAYENVPTPTTKASCSTPETRQTLPVVRMPVVHARDVGLGSVLLDRPCDR